MPTSFISGVTLTAQDVIDAVLEVFGDNAQVQLTTAFLIRSINMGQREILNANPTNQSSASTNLVAAQDTYDFSSLGAVNILSIRLNGMPLEYRTFEDAENYIVNSDPLKANTGDPVLWYSWGTSIVVYPVPSLSYSNGLTVFFNKNFTKVVNNTDSLSVPDQYFNSLVQYVLGQCYELDEDSQNSQFKLSQFENSVAVLATKEEGSAVGKYYPFITILPEDMY